MTTATTYHIRQFSIDDRDLYKAMRLEALLLEPSVFSSNYKREAAFTDEEWENRLTNPGSASFGLYYGDEMIGTTGIVILQPGEGILIASYIRKEHRGKGLSAMLYQVRLDWAKAKKLQHVIVSHRKNNIASRAANQHFGFRYTHEETMTWPDGIDEANVYYRLDL
jgi:RimJ/RimL family protein N-acetyltransferase